MRVPNVNEQTQTRVSYLAPEDYLKFEDCRLRFSFQKSCGFNEDEMKKSFHSRRLPFRKE